MSEAMNDHMAMIVGESASGKSASLINIPNQEQWLYLNCEAGKRLPFKNSFDAKRITNPYQVEEAAQYMKENPDKYPGGLIIDTATFLMDMLETQYVITATNTQQAWGEYAQFWKRLMQEKIAALDVPVLILAHARREFNEPEGRYDVSVPIKGSLKNNGLESYFSTVVAAKRMPLKDLEPYREGNELLTITPEDEAVGVKHTFQTKITKATVGERIRSPMGMWSQSETFIDNDANLLIERLKGFYDD